MADWMITCADLPTPLYDRLHELILTQPVIAADETTLTVVSEDKAKCYMWVYTSGADSPKGTLPNTDIPNIVLCDYQPNRAGQCAVGYLQGYTGYLQVDGYAGYHKLKPHSQAAGPMLGVNSLKPKPHKVKNLAAEPTGRLTIFKNCIVLKRR